MELLEKLAALVPPPRLHLVRYHGVLAPNAADRQLIVPGPPATEPDDDPTCCGHPSQTDTTPAKRAHRLAWARLLARVFLVDATVCPACGGTMKIVAALTDPASVRAYLEGVGLPARAPPLAAARPNPQHELEFAA